MLFAEIGFGNGPFISTEIESPNGEVRVNGWFVNHFRSVYLRLWVGKRVFIIDSREGIKVKVKTTAKFKLLFGIKSI